MIAETAYNVIEALPPEEFDRLLLMLKDKMKPTRTVARKKQSKVWDKTECTEVVLKILNGRKKRNHQQ